VATQAEAWTGTNTGPSATGKAVHMSGIEEWTLTPTGLIAKSLGHHHDAEYRRQVTATAAPPP